MTDKTNGATAFGLLGKAVRTLDSFFNFNARLGIGANNQTNGSTYRFDFVSRNRVQMEAMYRSSWIAGKAIDCVADDMTRAGIDITSEELKPEDIEQINNAFDEFRIWNELNDTIKWSRLYGGAIAVFMIDGQDPSTPLRIETIQKDQFKGLLVLDRWLVQPSLEDLVTEYGSDMGKPKYYTVVADAMALVNQKIHYSRVIRLEGLKLPYWQRIAENLWGQSIVERLWDRLVAFDSTTQGAAQLVYKAHLRTYKVKDFRQIITQGGKALEGLIKQMEQIRLWQSNEGLTLMDDSDTFETHSYTFSGLDAVLLQMGQQLGGAVDIPLTRLFSQSPAGMNATGESDLRNYYDRVNADQNKDLRQGLTKILRIICRSVLGIDAPKNLNFKFNPLWQLSDTEKSTIAQAHTAAIVQAEESGLVGRADALRELRHSSRITGLWSSISNEDIEAAENEPPLPKETDLDNPDDETKKEPDQSTKD